MSLHHPPAIVLSNLSKVYKTKVGDKNVLSDLSFSVGKGEALGLIGKNGSGKTTLLKILSGIIKPTSGQVHLLAQTSSLIDLEQNIIPDLSGRENISLALKLNNVPRASHKLFYEQILDFAELHDEIERPVKNYSSGMTFRLGFSILVHLTSDILLIDEIISVGDANFRKKSFAKVKELIENGATVVLASHDMNIIKSLCSKTVLLDHGNYVFGFTTSVFSTYLGVLDKSTDIANNVNMIQNDVIELIHVVTGNKNAATNTIFSHTPLVISVWFALKSQNKVGVTLNLSTQDSMPILSTGIIYANLIDQSTSFSEGHYIATVELPSILLSPNSYVLGIDFHDRNNHVFLSVPSAHSFEVKSEIDENLVAKFYRSFGLQPMLECKISPLKEHQAAIVKDNEQKTSLHKIGYVKLPTLSASVVQELRSYFMSNLDSLEIEAQNQTIISLNHSSPTTRKEFNDFINNTLAEYLNETFSDYKIIFSSYIAKLKDKSATIGFHQEPTLVDPEESDEFTLWIPLEDIGEGDGCLILLPLSHLWANRINYHSYRPPYLDQLKKNIFDKIIAKKGEAILFYNRLIHASLENLNKKTRVAISIKLAKKDAQIYSYFKSESPGMVDQFYQPDDFYFEETWNQDKRPDAYKFSKTIIQN